MNKIYKTLILLFALSTLTLVGCNTTSPVLTKNLPRIQTEDFSKNPPKNTLLLLERTSTSTIQSIKAKISELEPGTTTIYDF